MKFIPAAFTLILAFAAPLSAQAFSRCTSTALSGPGGELADEGSNPVAFGARVYAGFTQGGNVTVVPAADFGSTLSAPVAIYTGNGVAGGLRLGVSHQNVYALWKSRDGKHTELMFDASHGYGEAGTWDTPLDLGPIRGQALTQLSADGRNVHLAFAMPDGTVSVRNSTDAGGDFSAPVPLGLGDEVVIVSHGQDVYAAWSTHPSQQGIALAASHDGGASFSINDVSGRDGHESTLALDPATGRLSLAWVVFATHSGSYVQSEDGISWTPPMTIDTPARQFTLADGGKDIYIAYFKDIPIDGRKDWQAYVTVSSDGGATFSPHSLSGASGIARIVADGLRPIPWSDGQRFTVTGLKSDGVYVWSGRNGSLAGDALYLGAGNKASPAGNAVVWLAPGGVVTYAYCQ
ncbi:MAG TPA: hypothetical protein VIM02_02315 [Rhizomicrobium sp.]|jgi:hypothetical protein